MPALHEELDNQLGVERVVFGDEDAEGSAGARLLRNAGGRRRGAVRGPVDRVSQLVLRDGLRQLHLEVERSLTAAVTDRQEDQPGRGELRGRADECREC